MGTTLRGVRGEPSPVQIAQFFPNDITVAPKKEVVTQREMAEDAVLKRHLFETPYFSFLPSFHLHAVIAGKGNTSAGDGFDGAELVAAPSGNGNVDGTGDGKSTAWLQQAIAYVGSTGGRANLSFKLIK